jgi:hypothetical protein
MRRVQTRHALRTQPRTRFRLVSDGADRPQGDGLLSASCLKSRWGHSPDITETEGGACCHPSAAMQALAFTSFTPDPDCTYPQVFTTTVVLWTRHLAKSCLNSLAS